MPQLELLLREREIDVRQASREAEGKLQTLKLTAGEDISEKQAAQLERWETTLAVRKSQLDMITDALERVKVGDGVLDLSAEDGTALDLRLLGKQSASTKLAERGRYRLLKVPALSSEEGAEQAAPVPLTWVIPSDPVRRSRGDSMSNVSYSPRP